MGSHQRSLRKRFVNIPAAVALALPVIGFTSIPAIATVPSFPGADGAGATVTGGTGGVVYHVTKLDTKLGDNGIGTFQYGINDSNFTSGGVVTPRTIVFDVGGTIWLGLKTTDVNGWDTQNAINVGTNVTIAGQTAPGGITIMGSQVKVNGKTQAGSTLPVSNTIIRNVTMAVGYGMRKANSTSGYYDNYTYDNMDINSSGVMVDHVTALYSTDESISANEMANNISVQYSTLAQGQSYPQADAQGGGAYKAHALGDLWGLGSNAVSTFSHNLYANTSGRIPTIQTVASKLTNNIPAYTDFRNNVVYNWFGSAGYGSAGEPGAGEFEGNYYKVGPGGDGASNNATDFSIVPTSGGTTVFTNSSSTPIYQTGNVEKNLSGSTTNLTNSNFGSSPNFQSVPYSQIPYKGVTDTAATAYNQVLSYVGPNWQNRDAIDTRLVNEVMTGTGKIAALDDVNNGYNSAGVYKANDPNDPDLEWNRLLAARSTTNGGNGATGSTFTRAANYDTDQDGMPDIWETAMGLNPGVADNNGSVMNDGYTNLDSYLNEVAAWPASTALIFNNANGTGRYAEIGNWQTGVNKPTRYDTVQVDSGTATVNVSGQHAGTLKIATNAGNASTLSVTGGWLDVAQSLLIGPGGAGAVNQSNGIVRAGTSVVIGGTNNVGAYNLSGGTLSTPLLTMGAQGGVFSFTGGTLHANLVTFSLTNHGGIIAPGSDLNLQVIAAASMPDINNNIDAILPFVGNTHVTGNLTLQTGTLQMELASPSSFDTITVDNALSLGGNLDVHLLNGYSPAKGDQWKIGTYGSISGSFASIPSPFAVQSSGGNLFLVVANGFNLNWNNTGATGDGKTWDSTNQNWNSGFGLAQFHADDNVTFGDGNNANYSVTLNSTVTPGSVNVNNSTGNYVIAGTGSIGGTGSLTKTGSSTLTLNTANTYTGGTTVSAGTLLAGVTGALPNGNLAISGTGNVKLATNTGQTNLTGLSITGGSLDLVNNHVILSYSSSPFSTILGYVKTAAITSSLGDPNYSIGVVDGADGIGGAAVVSGQIDIAYALYGDANLDGVVNGTDFTIFASSFGKVTSSGWEQGDFDYSGTINGTDFTLFAQNFGKAASGAAVNIPAGDFAALDAFAAANGLSLASVPEPASVGLLALGSSAILARRKRRIV